MIAKTIDQHFRRQASPEVWEEVDALRARVGVLEAALKHALADVGCVDGALCPHWIGWHRLAREALRPASGIEGEAEDAQRLHPEGESPAPERGDALDPKGQQP